MQPFEVRAFSARQQTLYNRQQSEQAFYQAYFEAVAHWAANLENVIGQAYQISCKYGLAAMDALHIASAVPVGAEAFITTESPTKPMFRVQEITVRPLMANG
ncbi:MAG: hypothetical protein AAF766_18795 [Cyanobacteria bacterium P01_D01_bin.14]